MKPKTQYAPSFSWHALVAVTVLALAGTLVLQGCTDSLFTSASEVGHDTGPTEAPVSAQYAKLRNPQLMDAAATMRQGGALGKSGSAAVDYNLVLSFEVYEADRVTRRVLNRYDITRRILDKWRVTRRILNRYEYCDEGSVPDVDGYCDHTPLRLRLFDELLNGISVQVSELYLDSLLLDLQNDPDFAWIDWDALLHPPGSVLHADDPKNHQVIPWSIDRVGARLASFDPEPVHVYILDSGVHDKDLHRESSQKDFTVLFTNRDQEFIEESELLAEPIYDPKIKGNPEDENGHGSHTAGIVAAKDNEEGIRGIAPNVKVFNYKVLDENGRTDITTVIAAVDYITDRKLKDPDQPMVVNMSFGADIGTSAYNVLDQAILRSIEAGVVYVVSAGNDGKDAATYSPAHVAGAITVGAFDMNNQFASFSNYGSVVDILAPGTDIASLPNHDAPEGPNPTVFSDGTSTATPHVTGAAAIYLSLHPDATPQEVRDALVHYAQTDVQGVPTGTTSKSLDLSVFAFNPDDDPEFTVSKAKWYEDRGELEIAGKARRLKKVKVKSAGTGKKLGDDDPEADYDGNWAVTLTLEDLEDAVPCAILAQEGEKITKEVANAPADCESALKLQKAEWISETNELYLEGEGVKNLEVLFMGVMHNNTLSSTIVDAEGNYSLRVQFQEDYLVPCEIRAVSGAMEAIEQVNHEPYVCDYGRYNEQEPYEITEAKWKGDTAELVLEGTGTREVDVFFNGRDYGTDLGVTRVYYDGTWTLTVAHPAIVPCDIVATSEGQPLEIDVQHAPEGCEQAPFFEDVAWSAHSGELHIQATGTGGMAVALTSTHTGTPLPSPAFDAEGTLDLALTSLAEVPCSVTLEAGGVSTNIAVDHAPLNCDGMTYLNVEGAEWKSNKLKADGLAFSGTGTTGGTVTLTSVATGASVGTAAVDDDGEWAVEIANLATVPCTLRATFEGTVHDLAVKDAPASCQ